MKTARSLGFGRFLFCHKPTHSPNPKRFNATPSDRDQTHPSRLAHNMLTQQDNSDSYETRRPSPAGSIRPAPAASRPDRTDP